MESRLILRIDGTRHTMGRLKAGTYRQIILLGEDYKKYAEQDIIDDMVEIIKEAFGLTKEQAEKIDAETILPTFTEIQKIAQRVFTVRAAEIPNADGPEGTNQTGPS